MSYIFITQDQVDKDQNISSPFGPLGELVDLRTYRRWLPELGRRETIAERNARVVTYNVGLAVGIQSSNELEEEAQLLYEMLNDLKVWPSGRTAWVGGTHTAELHPASNFNCSFLAINRLEAFCDLFELLMLGTGVGFRVHKKDIYVLPRILNTPSISYTEYEPHLPEDRLENTRILQRDGDTIIVEVGDSRGGWIDALRILLSSYTGENMTTHLEGTGLVSDWLKITDIEFDLNSIRPIGERINGFGGTASGPSALMGILNDVFTVLKECPNETIRSIDAMDVCTSVARGVVAGSSRRSALICLFEEGDNLCATAKKGLYTDVSLARKSYRSQSNNTENIGAGQENKVKSFLLSNPDLSIDDESVRLFLDQFKPSLESLKAKFESVKTEGEPGFDNWARMQATRFYAARKWRPNQTPEQVWQNYCDVGTNPCFAPGTLILTKDGHFPIESLVGKTVDIWDGTQWVTVDNFRVTGTDKEVYDVELQSGQVITATDNHAFVLSDGTRKKLFELEIGDELLSHDHQIHGQLHEPGAYLKGFLLGDGTSTSDRPLLHLYDSKYACAEKLINSCKEIPVETVSTNAVVEPGFKEPVGNKSLMQGLSVRKLDLLPWVTTQRESLSHSVLNWSYESKIEFLAGFFDADGTACDTKNGFTYQVTSIHKETLSVIQLLLQSIGVYSTLRLRKDNSRINGTFNFGENTGGVCQVKPAYRLTIGQADSVILAKQIKFIRLLDFSCKTVSRNFRARKFKVRSITFNSIQKEVYCCTVPTNNQVSLSCNTVVGQCHEIILNAGYNGKQVSFCNLTEVPVANHLIYEEGKYELDYESLERAFRMAARIGTRQTCVDMPYDHMDVVQKEERLLGVSGTGWRDVVDALGWSTDSEDFKSLLMLCRKWANDEATQYSQKLGIPRPLLVTTIKPSGTCSQIMGCGSGLHWEWAPYYIRRIRMSAADALAKTLIEQGFSCYPELYDLETWRDEYAGILSPEEWLTLDNWKRLELFDTLSPGKRESVLLSSNTVVFEFPVKSLSKESQGSVSALEQLENMKNFTLYYCDHMPSSTITVKEDEWDEVIEWVHNNWSSFTTASFLPYFGGGYPLLPNEEIGQAEYEERVAQIDPAYKRDMSNGKVSFHVDENLLRMFELEMVDPDDVETLSDCEGKGLCPAR